VSVGDEVYGLIDGLRDGWAAEYVAIEARRLAPKPTTVDFVEAAAIPQAALTRGRRSSTTAVCSAVSA
jgi:NADPH:quinone reductase and related Zn-dependent oxidoreductases